MGMSSKGVLQKMLRFMNAIVAGYARYRNPPTTSEQRAEKPVGTVLKQQTRNRAGVWLAVLLSMFASTQWVQAANYATGGDGLYKEEIIWLTWGGGVNGTFRQPIGNGSSSVSNLTIGGTSLVITCTISNIADAFPPDPFGIVIVGDNRMESYRPGAWVGDGLDNLYNIGGTGNNNDLVTGIINVTARDDVQFTLTCNATADGAPFRLAGFVVADAEQNANVDPSFDPNSDNERIVADADGDWFLLDRYRNPGCPFYSNVNITGSVVTINSLPLVLPGAAYPNDYPDGFCGLTPSPDISGGPAVVTYLDYNDTAYAPGTFATTHDLKFYAGGGTSIAMGVFLPIDFGDAPTSYGEAAHIINRSFSPPLPVGDTHGFNAALATQQSSLLRIGAEIDAEISLVGNAGATADDASGTDDEDGLLPLQQYDPAGGMSCTGLNGTYTTAANEYCAVVTATNNSNNAAQLVGFLDYNVDDIFNVGAAALTPSERSVPINNAAVDDGTFATGNIPAMSATRNYVLVWQGLGDLDMQSADQTYLRLRLTTDTSFFSDMSPSATGAVADGEVEDHVVRTNILPVTLSSFSSVRDGNYVDIDWGTSSELFNVGFQLWGLDGVDGQWSKLHNWIVRSGSGNAVEPQSYSKRVRVPSSIDQLVSVGISSVDSDGSEHYYGPFDVGQAYGDLGSLEPIAWDDVRAELDAQMAKAGYIKDRVNGYRKVNVDASGSQTLSTSTDSVVEFSVSTDGLYRITSAELAAAGIDWSEALKRDIALIDAAGEPLVRYIKSGRRFGAGGEIYFYGHAPDAQAGLYTDHQSYRLVLDRYRALNAPTQGKSGVSSGFSARYTETSMVEDDKQYILTSAADDPWLSAVVTSEAGKPRLYGLSVPVEADADLSHPMVLHMSLGKSSDLPGVGDEHVVRGLILSAAGEGGLLYLDPQSSNDTGLWDVDIEVPGNTPLTLGSNGQPVVGGEFSPGSGYGFSEIHVDSMGLSYARPYVPKGDDNHLEFNSPNAGELGHEVIIPDVGHPWVFASDGGNLMRVALESARRSTDADGNKIRTVRFGVLLGQDSALGSSPLRYWVGARDQASSVTGLSQREIASQDSLITQALGSNYLLIAHPMFIDEEGAVSPLTDYAGHKQGQGYNASIINYLDVVDAYGGGQAGPAGLTNYLTALEAQGAGIDHVLLVGGSTYDHTGNGASGALTFIPGHYGQSNYSQYTVSDAPYVMDGDDAFANIGRWPVRSMADLQVIVDKSILWSNTDHSSGEALLIAEHTVAGENIDFGAALASSVEPQIPANWNQTQVDVDDILAAGQAADPSYTLTQALAQAKADIISGLNSTPDVVLYNGHASTRQLSNQNLFKSGDVGQVTASGAEVWLPMSCYVTFYESTHVNTLAYQLLFSGNAVNITGAMLLSNQSENIQMGSSILGSTMNQSQSIGEAVNQAKAAQNNAKVDINWSLLGDPTIQF